MKFFKQNSYDITKLFIYQIGMTVFGLILSFASIMSKNGAKNGLTLAFGIFSACFYLYLIYAVMWDLGSKDKIRVDSGRKAADKLHGVKLMLVAQVPNIVIVALMWAGALLQNTNESLSSMLYGIGHPIAIFIQGMYLGIVSQFTTKEAMLLNALMYTLTILPAVLASGVGYILGLKDIRFLTSPYAPKE